MDLTYQPDSDMDIPNADNEFYECDVCALIYLTPSELKDHLKTHLYNDDRTEELPKIFHPAGNFTKYDNSAEYVTKSGHSLENVTENGGSAGNFTKTHSAKCFTIDSRSVANVTKNSNYSLEMDSLSDCNHNLDSKGILQCSEHDKMFDSQTVLNIATFDQHTNLKVEKCGYQQRGMSFSPKGNLKSLIQIRHNNWTVAENGHSPENVTKDSHSTGNVAKDSHSAENVTIENSHSAENVTKESHSVENVNKNDYCMENVTKNGHFMENITRNSDSAENVTENGHCSEEMDDLCKSDEKLDTKLGVSAIKHKLQKNYKCLQCGEQFSWKGEYHRHLATHGAEGAMQCVICKELLFGNESLEDHIKTHPQYRCHVCEETYYDINAFNQHVRQHKVKKHNEYSCPVCKELFENKDALAQHVQQHKEERTYKCELCGSAFGWASALERHDLICGQGTQKTQKRQKRLTFQCHICGKKVLNKQNLKLHLWTHEEQNNREKNPLAALKKKHPKDRNQCDICGRLCATPSALRVHQRKYTKEKPFECPLCNKRFGQKSGLDSHHRTVHVRGDEVSRDSKCTICNRIFVSSSYLDKHMKEHMKEHST